MKSYWRQHTAACVLLFAAIGCGDENAPEATTSKAEAKQNQAEPEAQPMEESQYHTGDKAELPAVDPEKAWAAIPDEMRPERLLPGMKQKLLVPDTDKHGVAMFTDIVKVEPGEDVTFCTYTGVVTDKLTYIHDTSGSQTNYGHHAIMQYTTAPNERGTRKCEQESLEAQQGQILGGTGGEGTSAIVLPSNVVSEVPAGSQFIINHHWINTSDHVIEVQAEMITIPPDSQDDLVVARALTVVGTGFEIPAMQTAEHSVTCMLNRDVKMLSMLGHEHSWGTHVKAERMGAQAEVLFDHDYDEAMISHPINRNFPITAPYGMDKGEGIRMTCNWNNTTDHALTFPREMCVMFGWQVGADKDSACINGSWMD
jgi:hypothetical protein